MSGQSPTSGPLAALPALSRSELIQALKSHLGLRLSPGIESSLDAALRSAASNLQTSPEMLLRRVVLGEATALRELAEHTSIGETYFYRQHEQLEALTSYVRTQLASQPSVKVWSAGCSSGEEPYSLAMVLRAECQWPEGCSHVRQMGDFSFFS